MTDIEQLCRYIEEKILGHNGYITIDCIDKIDNIPVFADLYVELNPKRLTSISIYYKYRDKRADILYKNTLHPDFLDFRDNETVLSLEKRYEFISKSLKYIFELFDNLKWNNRENIFQEENEDDEKDLFFEFFKNSKNIKFNLENCPVCDELIKRKLSCGHALCVICNTRLESSICPVCRSDI